MCLPCCGKPSWAPKAHFEILPSLCVKSKCLRKLSIQLGTMSFYESVFNSSLSLKLKKTLLSTSAHRLSKNILMVDRSVIFGI
jgi:hypothetical protein